MNNFFVKYRKLEDELANPTNAFMRSTLHEMKTDIDLGANTSYVNYTPEVVEYYFHCDKERSKQRYVHWEKTFLDKHNQKRSLTYTRRRQSSDESDCEVNEGGYTPGTDGELSNTEDVLSKQLKRGIAQNRTSVFVKVGPTRDQCRLKFLAHRIKSQTRALLNARQFIRQAEEMISKRSERDKRQLEQLRNTYSAYKKTVCSETLSLGSAFVDEVDYADAEKFAETHSECEFDFL